MQGGLPVPPPLVLARGGEAVNPRVHTEFANLLPPLRPGERAELEDAIVREGCRDAFVVWSEKGILLDGHQRMQIGLDQNLTFDTERVSLPDRNAAKIWVIRRHIGRRNLTRYWRALLALQAEPLIAGEQLGRRCYAIEICPLYCDVAVRRWEAFTGRKAVRQNSRKRPR